MRAGSQAVRLAGMETRAPVRRRRVLVGTLLAVAFVTGLLAMFAVWVNRQVLNTDNWTDTSSQLLADPDVQKVVSAYLVDELFSSVDVAAELEKVLPPQAAVLAGPASAGLREFANRAAPRLLASPPVQDAWQKANSVAHAQLVKILEGGGPIVSTTGGDVVLNVRPLVDRLADELGIQKQVDAARTQLQGSAGDTARGVAEQRLGVTLPESTGQIVIMESDELDTAQTVARGIRNLSVVLTAVTLFLFALAVWLAVGWRRNALRTVGWCFIALGLVVLLARRVAGNQLIDSLVASESVKPAADSVWAISTTLLYDIAIAMFAYGVVFVIAAWLGGATGLATGTRRALAPSLRYRLGSVYGVAALLFLAVIAWGPTPATQKPLGIVGFALLVALGIEVLRRQVAREFPDAQPGQTADRLRAWASGARGRIGRMRPARPVAANGEAERIGELERLASLHDRGVLDDEEFASQKVLILNGS
jgi:hypothetical protein